MQEKKVMVFKGCWEMANSDSTRESAVSCMETCDGEMVAAPPDNAESWLHANMKLWPGKGQSRELCTGLMVVLVWVTRP